MYRGPFPSVSVSAECPRLSERSLHAPHRFALKVFDVDPVLGVEGHGQDGLDAPRCSVWQFQLLVPSIDSIHGPFIHLCRNSRPLISAYQRIYRCH